MEESFSHDDFDDRLWTESVCSRTPLAQSKRGHSIVQEPLGPARDKDSLEEGIKPSRKPRIHRDRSNHIIGGRITSRTE